MENNSPTNTSTIPPGYCQCGCGQQTGFNTQNRPKRGYRKGDPIRFATGHHAPIHGPRRIFERPIYNPDIPVGFCQCGCGAKTPLARQTRFDRGDVQGQPMQFIGSHRNRFNSGADYVVNPITGCWEWQKFICKHTGYARTGRNDHHYAHRYYFELKNGPIPDGFVLDHKCRVRHCVNPDHLEIVTGTENNRRGVATKLTKEQVMEIKRLLPNSTNTEIASQFGVTHDAICKIRKGKNWADIQPN